MARRLAAIMAGDVVGYSRLMADDEAGTYDSLRAGVDEVVVPSVTTRGGRVFKTTGDGFLAVFDSAGEALDAAVAIQDGFAGRPLQLRIGLNLGDVIQDQGDVFGDGVNVAARLEAMAEPGGVCASVAVVRAIGRRSDLHFTPLGRRRGKNLPDPIEVHALRRGPAGQTWLPRGWALAAAASLALAVGGGAVWQWGEPLTHGLAQHLSGVLGIVAANADTRPTVAVLPFDNLSGDPAQGYFSDGLSEDIITGLARNRELMVIARNSTFAFKDRPTDIREVGTKLGARYVVEGSTRRAGDQLRVVAQLIDAETGVHLWSQSYDRRVADVFAVQTDVTRQIVAALGLLRARLGIVVGGRAADRVAAGLRSGAAGPRALPARQGGSGGDGGGARPVRPGGGARPGLCRGPCPAGPDGHRRAHERGRPRRGRRRSRGRAGPGARGGPAGAGPGLGYQVLSYGLAENGDYQGGLQAAQRAVELNASDPDSLMALAKAQVRFGSYDEAVTNAALGAPAAPDGARLLSLRPRPGTLRRRAGGEAQQVMAECLLDTPREANCLRIEAVYLVRLDRVDEARAVMARLIAIDPAFSVAVERRLRRFGDSPLMQLYLTDLASAGAPPGMGQAAITRPGTA